MFKLKKTIFAVTLLVPILISTVFAASDYTYSEWGEFLPAPPAYENERVIRNTNLGVDSLEELTDVFVKNDKIYIAEKTKIIITDKNFNAISIISNFDNNGVQETINKPSGIFVTDDENIYVCEPEKERVLQFNSDFSLNRILGKPDSVSLENVQYVPTKVVVDSVGRIFITAKNVYEGIIQLNPDGTFARFFGANKVKISFVDIIWRSISTKAQRKQQKLLLPTDFNNMSIDDDGFIYATVQESDSKEPVKKLNAKGENILRKHNYILPIGDMKVNKTGKGVKSGSSDLMAVTPNDIGMYTVLDGKRGRVFTYDDDGYLLYVFGGLGETNETFRIPVDVEYLGDKILVVDQLGRSINVFKPTLYGDTINKAIRFQYDAKYDEAAIEWEKVLNYNSNYNYAYVGIGKSLLRKEDYKAATVAFKKGGDQTYYSKAYKEYRNNIIRNNFTYIILGIFALIVLIIITKIIKRYNRNKKGGSINE